MTVVRMGKDGQASTTTRPLATSDAIVDTAVPLITSLYDQPLGVSLGDTSTPISRRTLAYTSWGVGAGALLIGSILAGVAVAGFNPLRRFRRVNKSLYEQQFRTAQLRLGYAYTFFALAAVGAGTALVVFRPPRVGRNRPSPPSRHTRRSVHSIAS